MGRDRDLLLCPLDHRDDEGLEMKLLYLFMVIVGIAGIGLGFWGQHSLKRPYDSLSALMLPFSLVLGLLGVLLLCIPLFFG